MILLTISPILVEQLASAVLFLAVIYLLIGLVFYFPFIWKGIYLIDEGAQGSPKAFFLLILPGTLAFWPVLLAKWRNAYKQLKL